MSRKKPSLVKNAVSNWLALAANVLAAFFLTPFIISYIGKSGYGAWSIIVSLIGYYGLLDVGISSAVTRYIARFSAQDDEEALERTASTAIAFLSFLGLAVSLLPFLLSRPLADFFRMAGERREHFVTVVQVVGVATGISFPVKAFRSILLAYERFVPNNVLRVGAVLLRAGLTVVFLRAGFGLSGIGYVYLIVHAVELLAYILLVKLLVPEVKLRISRVERSAIGYLVSFGFTTFLITMADQFRFNLDSFVIARMIDVSAVAVYRIAALIMRYVMNLLIAALAVLTPRFARMEGQGDSGKLKELFLKALSVSSFLSFGACMMVFVAGGKFIQIWVGEDFYGALPVLWILAGAYAFALAQNPGLSVLMAKNRHSLYAWLNIGEAVLNVILSVILAPRLGIVGVALGTAVPMLIVKLFIQPVYLMRVMNISAWDYSVRMLIPGAAAAAGVFLTWRIGLISGWEDFSLLKAGGIAGALALFFSGVVLGIFRKKNMFSIRLNR